MNNKKQMLTSQDEEDYYDESKMLIKNDIEDHVRIDEPKVSQPKETMEIA